jgi:hypothetical protein
MSLPQGWVEVFNQDGIPYYYAEDDDTNVVWERPTESPQAKVTPPPPPNPSQPQTQSQPSNSGEEAVNRPFTEEEKDTINSFSVADPSRYVAIADTYDDAFDELKDKIQTSQPQSFDLSTYTARLTKFHEELLSRLSRIKEKLDNLSKVEGLSVSLVDKLYAARELFKSASDKLGAVNNDPTEYEALGKKITELEALIAEIDTYPGIKATGGKSKKRRTKKQRKSRSNKNKNKNKKTKKGKRMRTKKRGRLGGSKCGLWRSRR